jgi:hypothetical protein
MAMTAIAPRVPALPWPKNLDEPCVVHSSSILIVLCDRLAGAAERSSQATTAIAPAPPAQTQPRAMGCTPHTN